MISTTSHSKDWLEQLAKSFPKKDRSLIARVVKALALVEQLQTVGLKFVFKGGTSLILLIDEAHRFSIDVDIVIEEKPADLESYFKKVLELGTFTKFDETRRKDSGVPKSHYKFTFEALTDANFGGNHILLDILYEEDCYSETKLVPVRSRFIDCIEPFTEIRIPSIDAILGDKLTAFAPNTTGVPYGKEKDLEIAKQLFDVGQLFTRLSRLSVVGETFKKIAEKEIGYRKLTGLTHTNVLDDVFETSRTICLRGKGNEEKFKELQAGIRKLDSYLYTGGFSLEDAFVPAAKAAYLAQLLKGGIPPTVEKYSSDLDMTTWKIENANFSKFDKLKKSRPEAFFYWYKAVKLIGPETKKQDAIQEGE